MKSIQSKTNSNSISSMDPLDKAKKSSKISKISTTRRKHRNKSPSHEEYSYFQEQQVFITDDISIPQSETLSTFDDAYEDVVDLSNRSQDSSEDNSSPTIRRHQKYRKAPFRESSASSRPSSAQSDGSDLDWLLEHAGELGDPELFDAMAEENSLNHSKQYTTEYTNANTNSLDRLNSGVESGQSLESPSSTVRGRAPTRSISPESARSTGRRTRNIEVYDLNGESSRHSSPYASPYHSPTPAEKERERQRRKENRTGKDISQNSGTASQLYSDRRDGTVHRSTDFLSPPGSLEDLAADLFLFKPSSRRLPSTAKTSSDERRNHRSGSEGALQLQGSLTLGMNEDSVVNAQTQGLPQNHPQHSHTRAQEILERTWGPGGSGMYTGGGSQADGPQALVAVGPVSELHAITASDICELRAYSSLNPPLWVVTRAMYVLLFLYLDVMGDSTMLFYPDSESSSAEDEYERGPDEEGNIEGGTADLQRGGAQGEGPVDMSNLWLALRKQRVTMGLTPANVYEQYSWPLLRQLMTMSRLLVVAMNQQIPTDVIFRTNFPDEWLPWVKKSVSSSLLKGEVLTKHNAGLKVARWARGVAALVWVEKGGRYIKSPEGADFHQVELQDGPQFGMAPSASLASLSVGGTNAVSGNGVGGLTHGQMLENDSWVSVPLFVPPTPQAYSTLSAESKYTWHRVPYSVSRHARPKVFSCAVDGLAASFAAYKVSTKICRPIDRLELLHIYSNTESMRTLLNRKAVLGKSSGLVPKTPSAAEVPDVGRRQELEDDSLSSSGIADDAAMAGGRVGLVFSADAPPGTIKAMYEAELVRDAEEVPVEEGGFGGSMGQTHRRVVCIARAAGRTVAEEFSVRARETGCDVLVLGMDRLSLGGAPAAAGLPGRETKTGIAARGKRKISSEHIQYNNSSTSSVSTSGRTKGYPSPTTATTLSVGEVRSVDRFKLTFTDLRRIKCAVVVASPTAHLNLDVTNGAGGEERGGNERAAEERATGGGRQEAGISSLKWMVAVGPTLCAFEDDEDALLSDSQAAVELALSLGRRGDSIIIMHVAKPPPKPAVDEFSNPDYGHQRRSMRERLLRMSRSYQAVYGIPVHVESLNGSSSIQERITELAAALKPDFLVMGEGAGGNAAVLSAVAALTGNLLTSADRSLTNRIGTAPATLANGSNTGVTESLLAALSPALGLGSTSIVIAKATNVRLGAMTAP